MKFPIVAWALSAAFGLASAQENPGWLTAPIPTTPSRVLVLTGGGSGGGAFDVSGGGLSSEEASRSLGNGVQGDPGFHVMDVVGNEADAITPEIQALAHGLRDDPAKIYEYVYNYIDYECYYGSKKGAQLTLLEGSGNDMDQAALLVALLRASGYTASYVHGPCAFPMFVYSAWWGFSSTPNLHISDAAISAQYGLTSPDAATLSTVRLLKAIQDAASLGGYYNAWPSTVDGLQCVSIPFTYVKFTVGAKTYKLSPAYKSHTRGTGLDLVAASQYNRTAFLAAAGGTVGTPDNVKNLNETGIGSLLTTYTTHLIDAFKDSSNQEKSVEELVGGRKISKKPFNSLDDALPMLPDTTATWGSPDETTFIRPERMSKLEITAGVTGTYNSTTDTFSGTPLYTDEISMPSLQGKKLSLAFSGTGGNTATIRLDDIQRGSSFTVSAANVQIRLKAKHGHYNLVPNAGATVWTPADQDHTNQSFAAKYVKGINNGYAFIYSFGSADRQLKSRQQKLDAYRQAGISDWQMFTESMDVMGLTYFKQVREMEKSSGILYDCIPMNHHAFGRAAQENGSFYIDVGLVNSSPMQYTMDDSIRHDYAGMSMLYTSAMEHGVIEQTQGKTSALAISTVRLVQRANAAGKKLFRATSTNKTSVLAGLDAGTYAVASRTAISNLLTTADDVMLLPQDGTIVVGSQTKGGYAYEGKQLFLMLIDTLNGGYNASGLPYSTDLASSGYSSDPVSQLGKSANYPNATYQALATPSFFTWDPIEMASGGYVLDKSDLVLGGGEAPFGLTFSRQYHSNRSADSSSGLGYGWTHNNNVFITERSAPEALMGGANGYQMASFLASAIVAKNLHTGQADAKTWATCALAVHWGIEQMKYTAVSVSIGTKSLQFIRLPDGTYVAPPGLPISLTTNAAGNYVMAERNGNVWTFNADKQLASITNPNGAAQTFTYNTSKQLTSVKDAFNRTLTYTWVGNNITSVSDGTTRSVSMANVSGNMTSFTDPEGKIWTYSYSTDHKMSSLKDPDNRTIAENDYDALGRVSKQRSMGDASREWTYLYTDYANTEINSVGEATKYLYDERGRGVGVTDPLGNSPIYKYDGQDRKITEFSKNGERLDWFFDADNCLLSTEDEEGYFVDYYYDGQLRVDEMWDKRGFETTYTYTANHQIQTVTDPLGHVITYTYTALGLPQTVKDGENKTTTTGYDAYGVVNKVTQDDGTFQSFTNNTRGDVLTSTDAENRTTTFTWNNRRQPLTTTRATIAGEASSVTTIAYDNSGDVLTTTDANGNVTSQTHNAMGQLLTTTQPSLPAGNNVMTTAYDVRNWAVSVQNSLGDQMVTGYDSAGSPTTMTDGLSRLTKTSYDPNGRISQVEDPLHQITKFGRNARGEVIEKTDPLLHNIDNTIDGNGNETVLKNRRSKNFSTTFDQSNRATDHTTPTGKVTSMTYWNNGLVKTTQEPSGQITNFTYNGKNLLSTKTDSTGSVSYGYDNSGLLTTVTEGSTVVTRVYDERGRVKTYSVAQSGVNQYTIGYKYDANDNVTRVTYPDGKQVNYTYNARNLMGSVTDWRGKITTYSYDRLGRVAEINRPNGTKTVYSYDAGNQLKSIRELTVVGLFSYVGLGYDDAGQITSRVQAPLIDSAWTHPVITATYDDDNRLAAVAGSSVIHDADGNMTSGPISLTSGNVTLGYNARNQLTGAGGITYTYDAEGIRRSSTDGTGVTQYVTDPQVGLSRLLVKIAPDGKKTFYVYGIGLLYEVDELNSAKTYHYDQIGNTVARTDESGNLIGRAAYSAYGLIAWKQGDMTTPFLSNGNQGVMTEASGLLYMRARYYSPYLMRFLNADPIGFSGGLNWYLYGGGNPISHSDASGLWFGFDDALFAGVGAVIGVAVKLVANVATGSEHHWEDYVGAAVGGAAGGETLLYTANPWIAGAAGGAAGNLTTQGLSMLSGRQESFNVSSLVVDTGVGALTGFIPGAKIPGISAGRGSYAQVFEQIVTKAEAGTISRITDETAEKMVEGAFTKYAFTQGTIAGVAASWFYGVANDELKSSGRK